MSTRRTLRDAILNSFTEDESRNLLAEISERADDGYTLDADELEDQIAAIVVAR